MHHGSEKKTTRVLENSLDRMKIKTQHIYNFYNAPKAMHR